MKKMFCFKFSFFVLLLCVACKNTPTPQPPGPDASPQAKDLSGVKETAGKPKPAPEDHKVITHRFAAIDPAANQQILEIITVYLSVKDDLVNSNQQAASAAAARFTEKTGGFDKSYLTLAQKAVYDSYSDIIKMQMKTVSQLKDLNKQREVFSLLTRNVHELASAFGYQHTLFTNECPMALNGQGAIWLSAELEIRNPYYGDAMLNCGKVTEEIK